MAKRKNTAGDTKILRIGRTSTRIRRMAKATPRCKAAANGGVA